MEKSADLHIHTNFSDSTSSPQEVVEQALEKGLACIAITDHDTVDGIQPTMDAAKDSDLEIIPGIELSTEYHEKDIHMLGYLFDFKDEEFAKHLKKFQSVRVERMRLMIEKLHELGIKSITLEEVCSQTQSDAVGRPHLAKLMIEKGVVKDVREAFGVYLGEGCPIFVPKFKQTPYEAIELIRKLGGVSVLAHPMVIDRDELIPSFVEAGMEGIEVYYANSSDSVIQYYEGIAKKHGLVMTGGSDAHGDAKTNTYLGKKTIPYELVEKLKAKAKR